MQEALLASEGKRDLLQATPAKGEREKRPAKEEEIAPSEEDDDDDEQAEEDESSQACIHSEGRQCVGFIVM